MFKIDILILIIIFLIAYFIGYFTYAKGINDGIKLEKGKSVTIVPHPIKKAHERRETAKNDKIEEEKITGIENMMSYTGFKQKVGE